VYSTGVDKIWAADLVDMKALSKYNSGMKYLLMVIDVYSRYGWIVPLKNKDAKSVAQAFKDIFKSGRKPEKLWVDKGAEFYNAEVKKLGMELYSTENEEKSMVVERWNRTIKERMFKYFNSNSTMKYVDILEGLVNEYNNTVHSSTGVTPNQSPTKVIEEIHVAKPKFKVGDRVRITRKKGTFEKGYTPNWTEEVFTISEVKHTVPPTYKIVDYNDSEIKGTFYEQELQKTVQEVYRIEKVIRKKGSKSLVKWRGYDDTFNSWIPTSEIVKSFK